MRSLLAVICAVVLAAGCGKVGATKKPGGGGHKLANNKSIVGSGHVQLYIDDLSSKDAKVREGACFSLGNLGTDAAPALPKLKALTKDKDRKVAQAATAAIKQIDK